jgi:hypothetical protein
MRPLSKNDVTPISESLTATDFLAGFNLSFRAGLSFTVQCENTAPSTGMVVGCAFNNRYDCQWRAKICFPKIISFSYAV